MKNVFVNNKTVKVDHNSVFIQQYLSIYKTNKLELVERN